MSTGTLWVGWWEKKTLWRNKCHGWWQLWPGLNHLSQVAGPSGSRAVGETPPKGPRRSQWGRAAGSTSASEHRPASCHEDGLAGDLLRSGSETWSYVGQKHFSEKKRNQNEPNYILELLYIRESCLDIFITNLDPPYLVYNDCTQQSLTRSFMYPTNGCWVGAAGPSGHRSSWGWEGRASLWSGSGDPEPLPVLDLQGQIRRSEKALLADMLWGFQDDFQIILVTSTGWKYIR